MGTSGKVAAAGALAGLLLALVAAPAMRRPMHPPIVVSSVDAVRQSAARPELAHCRTITVPDAACELGWEAERRRFFGTGGGR